MIPLLTLSLAHAADPVAEYADRRLVCWSETRYASTTTVEDDGTLRTSGGEYEAWGVRDGRGRTVPTTDFAARVGDRDLLAELEAGAELGARRGRTLLIGGVAAAGVGVGGMIIGGRTQAYPVVIGGSLALSGGGALAGYGLLTKATSKAPLEQVPLAYDKGLAHQRCAQHNDALRQELGLTREQTRAIDTAWTFAPRERHLALRPVVTLGSVGITGTF